MSEEIEIQDEIKEVLNDSTQVEEKPEVTEVEEKAEEKKEDKPNKVTAKDRIGQLVKKSHDKDRELIKEREEKEELKRQIEELKTPKVDKKPNQEEYESYMDYERDEHTWNKQEKAKEQRSIDEQVQDGIRAEKRKAIEKEHEDKWQKEFLKGKKKFEGFETSVQLVDGLSKEYGNTHFVDELLQSDKMAVIVDYLGNNVDEAEDILSNTSLRGAIKAVDALEKKLESKPKQKKDIPTPTDNAGGGESVSSDLSRLSQKEYNRRMNGIS